MIDKDDSALHWLNCLLVKEGVRPGYLAHIERIDTPLEKNYKISVATKYFKLNTFIFGEEGRGLFVTKEPLSDEDKEIISDTSNPEYHFKLGHILGYDCVDTFSLANVGVSRISIGYYVTLIDNPNSKKQLFAYSCPGIRVDGLPTITQENLDIAIRYLNNIKTAFRTTSYSNFIVSKITLDVNYIFPPPRHVNHDEIIKKGIPFPPVAPPVVKPEADSNPETLSSAFSEMTIGGSLRRTKRRKQRNYRTRRSKSKYSRKI